MLRSICVPILALAMVSPVMAQLQVIYRGLTHSRLGVARLVHDPNDTLLIDNVTLSGNDGAAIALGDAEFWAGRISEFDTSAGTGSFIRVVAGASRLADDLAVIQFTDDGALLDLSVELPLADGPTLHVQLFDETGLLEAVDLPMGEIAVIASEGDLWLDPIRDADGEMSGSIEFAVPTKVTLAGAPEGKTVVKLTFAGSGQISGGVVNSIEITGSGVGEIRLQDARLGKFGNAHRGFGQLQLEPEGVCPDCTLSVSNIGSDGDAWELEAPRPAESILWNRDSSWEPGSSLTISCAGRVQGVDDQPVSELTMQQVGFSVELLTDFSAIGAFSHTAEVFIQGTLVVSVPFRTNPLVATFPDAFWPTTQGFFIAQANPGGIGVLPHAGQILGWEVPVPIQIVGGPLVTGDQLVIFADEPDDEPGSLKIATEEPADLPQGIVYGELIEPVCPGDTNGDDVIDLTDLSNLLSHFGQAADATTADGDGDGDGDVDLTDLSLLLAHFGEAC